MEEKEDVKSLSGKIVSLYRWKVQDILKESKAAGNYIPGTTSLAT